MNIIIDYLLTEKHMTEIVAVRTEKKVSKYDDIRLEFEYWIQKRDYIRDNPIIIEDYSANDIYILAPFMDGLGVFTFMVTLRDEPEKAKEYINEGFKRK
jgi:uncharacterized membrane protein